MSDFTSILNENKTAFYVFDSAKLKSRIEYLRSLLTPDVLLCYAVKANTFIIRELSESVDRFEICSPGEERICRDLGVPDNMTVISGVYKTPEFIDELVQSNNGKIFTVESLTQFNMFKELAKKYDKSLKILIRLTNGSQFGINADEIREIVKNRAEYDYLDILGVQFFSGTQKTSLKKLKREVDKLDSLLIDLKENYGFTPRELEYGPGFPAIYFKEDEIDEDALIKGFAELLGSMTFKAKVTLELGRGIAAGCGSYYTHVVDKKRNNGENYLLIDGGMHQLVYYGQHMGMKHPFMSVAGKEFEPAAEEWNICGSLCSMNDIVCKGAPLPEIEIGDVLCFENTGAYCATEGISMFLSRDIPAVYIKKADGGYVCVRKPFESAKLNMPEYRVL